MSVVRSARHTFLPAAILAIAAAACNSDDPASPPAPVGTLVVTPERLVLGVGMSRQLTASVVDESGAAIAAPPVGFLSGDPSRASITSAGLVTYVAAGETELQVTSGDLSATIPYTGLRRGHPLAATTTRALLPGTRDGDDPFGVAVDGEGRIYISQAHTGRVASTAYPVTGFAIRDLGGLPTSIALLGGGTALVTPTGPAATDASVIDLSSDRVLAQVPIGVPAHSALTAPDSHTVWLGTIDGRVLQFDAASSSIVGEIDLEVEKSRVNHLALDAAGTRLYASSYTTGSVSEIDLATKSVVRLLVLGGEPQGLAVSADGTELYVADESGTGRIDVYDLANNTLVATIASGATTGVGGPFALAMSPDGAEVYAGVISDQGPGLIQVIDTRSRTIQRTIESCGHMPRRIAFGFSGGLAVIADETGCVTFVE
jgi:DNA-binding beta-propeller fold protein YncE